MRALLILPVLQALHYRETMLAVNECLVAGDLFFATINQV